MECEDVEAVVMTNHGYNFGFHPSKGNSKVQINYKIAMEQRYANAQYELGRIYLFE